MRRKLSLVVALALATPVMAQSSVDTLDELWQFQDAVPTAAGATDLRFSFGWETGNLHGSGDAFVLTPTLRWGVTEGWELSLGVPVWVGDGGDRSFYKDGNYDTNFGFLVRLMEQDGDGAAVALAGSLRVPTGDNSEQVDAELRLVATHDYGDSGVRSHFNVFGKSVNGGNDDTNSRRLNIGDAFEFGFNNDGHRDFQFGAIVGMDGPLCDEGAVRWVWDYMNRSSLARGESNANIASAGWEWTMNDADRLGMSVQVSLDHSSDSSDVGAIMTFAHALTY